MQIIVALVLNAVALLVTDYIVPGFDVADFQTAVLAAIVLGVVNTFINFRGLRVRGFLNKFTRAAENPILLLHRSFRGRL